jgi:hypothetical protein
MKSLPAFAILAALVAFVIFPLNFALAGSILFAVGVVTIAISDYARSPRPLTTAAARCAPVMAARAERFRLAA